MRQAGGLLVALAICAVRPRGPDWLRGKTIRNGKGGNPVLLESATDAVRKWKFEAASADTTEVLQLPFDPH